jgi:hypothetical protein
MNDSGQITKRQHDGKVNRQQKHRRKHIPADQGYGEKQTRSSVLTVQREIRLTLAHSKERSGKTTN